MAKSRALGLGGQHDHRTEQIGGEAGPRRDLDFARGRPQSRRPDVQHAPGLETEIHAHLLPVVRRHAQMRAFGAVDDDLALQTGGGDGKRGRFDVIGDDVVLKAAEMRAALDFDAVGAGAGKTRAHFHQHLRQVHHMRLAGRVFDHGFAGNGRSQEQRVFSGGHRRLHQKKVAGGWPGQGSAETTFQRLEHGAQRLQRFEMGFQTATTDDAAARRRQRGLAGARQECAQKQDRGAKLAGERFVQRGFVDVAVDAHSVAVEALDCLAETLQKLQHDLHIADGRQVGQDAGLVGEHGGGDDGQGGIFVAGHGNLTLQRMAAFDNERLHDLSLCEAVDSVSE